MDPREELHLLVERLHEGDEPDLDLIGQIGCGELEDLIRDHGEELWPDIERLARADPVFRRALRSVWAYDSPEFERRDHLLAELGEHWPVAVRFVVEPEDFLPEPRLSWRAIEIEGEPPAGQLSRLLREIAEWYERDRGQDRNPYVTANRMDSPSYYEWARATWALQRAWHRLVVAPDEAAYVSATGAVEDARAREHAAWREFLATARTDSDG